MRRFGNGGNTKTLFRFVFRPSSKRREQMRCSCASSAKKISLSLKVTIRSALCYSISLMAPFRFVLYPNVRNGERTRKERTFPKLWRGKYFHWVRCESARVIRCGCFQQAAATFSVSVDRVGFYTREQSGIRINGLPNLTTLLEGGQIGTTQRVKPCKYQ